jgi:hypothetical protein
MGRFVSVFFLFAINNLSDSIGPWSKETNMARGFHPALR